MQKWHKNRILTDFYGEKGKRDLRTVRVSNWGKSKVFEGGMTGKKRNFVQSGKFSLLPRIFPPNGTRTGRGVLDFFVRLCYDYGIKFGEEAGCGTGNGRFFGSVGFGLCPILSVSGTYATGCLRFFATFLRKRMGLSGQVVCASICTEIGTLCRCEASHGK